MLRLTDRGRYAECHAVCGWMGVGRGMTIGFMERAVRTDGPWLLPKIPLRKMAGLTYFWTHHAVQIHRDRAYIFIQRINPHGFCRPSRDNIRRYCRINAGINAVIQQRKNPADSYLQLAKSSFPRTLCP